MNFRISVETELSHSSPYRIPTMNSVTGDDLSINASYAAESVSLLFDLFVQETTIPDACG
jgi:hypothetical protein